MTVTGAKIKLPSQLHVETWKELLDDYWDQQLLQFLEFRFLVGFNRECKLDLEQSNHSSATEFTQDVESYLREEIQF